MSSESASGRRMSALSRALRASLVILCVIVSLSALTVGAAVTAQRYAGARAITVAAPPQIVYGSQQVVTLVQPAPENRRTTPPAPVARSCACAPTRQTAIVQPSGPQVSGQLVVVSIARQWLWAYQDGHLILSTAVTTGMPQLPTPTGTFHILMKESNVMFYSPWPYGSPYYYSPEYVQYAMLFLSGGFYLHSAGWRDTFGPGTNVPHTNPDGTQETGSHGCVNMPVSAAGVLYNWIGVGATVQIS